MPNLTQASQELFRRSPDECYETLPDLLRYCRTQKESCRRIKEADSLFQPLVHDGTLALQINGYAPYAFNDWSFSQFCSFAGASKETVNRLQPDTAAQVLSETYRQRIDGETDLQALVWDNRSIRSLNGERYKRLWNADLIAILMEFAVDFTPPQKGLNGATGLYAGDQDMFCFLIDPTGWTEIGGEAFAPGFFVWNSEVGKRTVGISTFWFQAICQNHIVWDATEVVEFTRRHTGKVRDSLAEIRSAVEGLVARRDERKDSFAAVIAKAMETSYGEDAETVQKLLSKSGFSQSLAKRAAEVAREKGRFTIWSVVDALTQLAREAKFAGDRTDAEQKAASLLALAVH